MPLYKKRSKESKKKISMIALIFKQIVLKKESNLPIKRNKENINKNWRKINTLTINLRLSQNIIVKWTKQSQIAFQICLSSLLIKTLTISRVK